MTTRAGSLLFDNDATAFDEDWPFGLDCISSFPIGTNGVAEDADWFDESDRLFGLSPFVAPVYSAVDASTLDLSALLLSGSPFALKQWTGSASAGTSLGHNFTSHAHRDDVANLALTSYIDTIAGLSYPLPGKASAGASGSRNWDEGLNPPAAGPTFGSATQTAAFVSASLNQLTASGVMSDYISASASSGWMIVRPTAMTNDSGTPAANDPVLMDTGGPYYGVTFQPTVFGGDGVTFGSVAFFVITSGVRIFASALININSWSLVQWRHTGTTVEIRVCSAGVVEAHGDYVGSGWIVVDHIGANFVGDIDTGYEGNSLRMGGGGTSGLFADFDFAGGGVIDRAFTYDEMDAQLLDLQLTWPALIRTTTYDGMVGTPSASASLNGYVGADFDHESCGLLYTGGFMNDFLGESSFYISAVVNARTVPTDAGHFSRYTNALIFGDGSSNVALTMSDAGVSAVMYASEIGNYEDITVACSANAWHLIQMWHDGRYLWLQVDNGTPQSVLLPLTWFDTYRGGMDCFIGGGASYAHHFDGVVHVLETARGVPNTTQRYNQALGLQNKYNVDFGFTLPSSAMVGSTAITLSQSGALTGKGALAGTTPISVTTTGTSLGAGALAGTTAISVTGSGTALGAGVLAGTSTANITGAATLSLIGTAAISVTGSGTALGAGVLAGTTPATITTSGTTLGAGVLAGTTPISVTTSGTMLATGRLAGATTATISGAATLSLVGNAAISITGSGTVLASGVLAGTTPITVSETGLLTGAGPLAGTTTANITSSGTALGSGALAATAPLTITPTGAVTGAGVLSASSTITFSETGVLLAAGVLAGAATVTLGGSGTIDQPGLNGSTTISFSESGVLLATGALAGSASATFTSAATLSLVATTALSITGSGTAIASGALAGSTGATITGSGAAFANGALAGASSVSITSSGTLTGQAASSGATIISFASAAQALGAARAAATTTLSMAAAAVLIATGALTGNADVSVTTAATGTLYEQGAMFASSSFAVTGSGALIATASVTGAAPLFVGTSAKLLGFYPPGPHVVPVVITAAVSSIPVPGVVVPVPKNATLVRVALAGSVSSVPDSTVVVPVVIEGEVESED